MALVKVPGSKGKYRADPAGLREIGRSQAMSDACMIPALRGAALAKQYDPKGTYDAEPRGVRAGYNNEIRNGAAVVQTVAGPNAIKRMVMADVLLGMESQRGSARIPGR